MCDEYWGFRHCAASDISVTSRVLDVYCTKAAVESQGVFGGDTQDCGCVEEGVHMI